MIKKMMIGLLGIASLSFAGNIKNVEAITEVFGIQFLFQIIK